MRFVWNNVPLQRKLEESLLAEHENNTIHSLRQHFSMPESQSHNHKAQKIDLKDFMEKNFRCDMPMSEFARLSGRSLSTFKRDFKAFSPLSPERWLTDRRLHASIELLKRGQRVTDTCFDVGFKNVSHFSAIFKRRFGVTPGDIRKGLNPLYP